MAIATPCTRICTLHPPSGLCVGCGRTGAEIAAWTSLDPLERETIMAELSGRLSAHGLSPAGGADVAP